MRPSLKCVLVGFVVAVVLSTAVPQANAHWHGYRAAWGCGYGCDYTPYYASCYSPCYATVGCYSSCYDSCGWYAGCRSYRRAAYSPWYAGGCYAGCYTGGCTGCLTGCDSCTGNGAPAPAQSPTPAKKPVAEPPIPAEPAPAAPAPAAPAPVPAAPKTTGLSAEESGILTVWVPYDAKVTVNGRDTSSTGSQRRFVSYGLKPGLSYKYEVKAQIVRNGQTQEDTRTVILTAGQITAVAFGFNVSAQQVASAH